MKQTIRVLLLLLLVMLLSVGSLAGCKTNTEGQGKDEASTTVDNQEDDGFVKDDLPELDFEGRAIRILTWEETSEVDWASVLNGENINDATYLSRQSVANRLNVTFDVSAQPGSWDYRMQFSTNLEAYMNSGIQFDLIGQYTPAAALTACSLHWFPRWSTRDDSS